MVDLGLAPREFWEATPRRLAKLLKRRRLALRREQDWEKAADYRAGVIAASTFNVDGGIRREGMAARAALPSDFFPWLEMEQTLEQKMEAQIAVWKALGAKDLRQHEA